MGAIYRRDGTVLGGAERGRRARLKPRSIPIPASRAAGREQSGQQMIRAEGFLCSPRKTLPACGSMIRCALVLRFGGRAMLSLAGGLGLRADGGRPREKNDCELESETDAVRGEPWVRRLREHEVRLHSALFPA